MKELLDIHIYTPEGVVFQGKAVSAKVPGAKGNFAVLPQHAPIISLLTEGKIVCQQEEQPPVEISIKGGFVEVKKNVISACVET